MNPTTYLCSPQPIASLRMREKSNRQPDHGLILVGRNYGAHVVELGKPVGKTNATLFHFTKAPSTRVESGARVANPPGTNDTHYEMELVVAIGAPAFRVPEPEAHKLIDGYAFGSDMTRRELQPAAREQGRPWDLGKEMEQSSVVCEIVPAQGGAVLGPADRRPLSESTPTAC